MPLKVWSRQAWLQPMQVLMVVGAAGRGLGDEVGVGEQRAGQRHQVGAPSASSLLGDLGGVDAVAGDERDGDLAHQPLVTQV